MVRDLFLSSHPLSLSLSQFVSPPPLLAHSSPLSLSLALALAVSPLTLSLRSYPLDSLDVLFEIANRIRNLEIHGKGRRGKSGKPYYGRHIILHGLFDGWV